MFLGDGQRSIVLGLTKRFFVNVLYRDLNKRKSLVTVESCNRRALGTKCANSRRDICKQTKR